MNENIKKNEKNEKIDNKIIQLCDPSPLNITTMLQKSFFYQIDKDTSNVTIIIIVNQLSKFLGISEFKQNIINHIDVTMQTVIDLSPTKTFNIYVDLLNLQIKLFNKNARSLIKILIKLFQDKYPDTLNKCMIVNATKIFKFIYKLIYYCLDDVTRKKIIVVSKNKTIMNSQDLL